MHIVFLVTIFPAGGLSTSGAGNYVANMARIMVRFGHKVTVITESPQRDIFEWQGIEVRRINATKGFKNTGRPMPTYKKVMKNIWRSIWYNYEVYKINRKEPVDIVQSVNTYALALLRLKKIPYVIRVSEYADLWWGANKEKFDFAECVRSRRMDNEIQYFALKRAERIIAPSYLLQRLIYNKTGKKPQVIESPVVIEKKDFPLNEKELSREKYWVTYGALNYRKSIQSLAQIIDKLLDEYPDMKYVMIGKDKEVKHNGKFMMASEYLEMHISRNRDRYIFLDEVSDRNRLFSIIKNSYACILPTRVDNLPNSCLEAMALKKVIVSTTSENGTSVEQLIIDGYSGFLAEVDNAEDLYRKIRKVMELSLDEKRKIEDNAYERVKDLTPEKVYVKMLEVYSDIARVGR